MSARGNPLGRYAPHVTIGVAAVALVSLRSGPMLIPLLKLAIALSLPALFIGIGLAVAGKGNRLYWLFGTMTLAGFGGTVIGVFHTDAPDNVWLDAATLLMLIVLPIASLVGAWVLARFHPVKP